MTGLYFWFDDKKSLIRIQHILETKDRTIRTALVDKMFVMMKKLEEKIVSEKLSAEVTGADTLRSETGTLARSVQAMPVRVRQGGGMVEGGVMLNTKTAPYGIFHLMGGSHVYRIPSFQTAEERMSVHALHFFWEAGQPSLFPGSGMGDKEFFRAWVQRKPLQKRDFMTSAFLEMQDEIAAELKQAVIDAMQPGFEGY